MWSGEEGVEVIVDVLFTVRGEYGSFIEESGSGRDRGIRKGYR